MTRVVQGVALGVLVLSGAAGYWLAWSSGLQEPTYDRVIGTAGVVGLVASLVALRRRSWARVPVACAALAAATLACDGLLVEPDPSDFPIIGYVVLSVLMALLGGVAIVITVFQWWPAAVPDDRRRETMEP